jgi:hypothetical protein
VTDIPVIPPRYIYFIVTVARCAATSPINTCGILYAAVHHKTLRMTRRNCCGLQRNVSTCVLQLLQAWESSRMLRRRRTNFPSSPISLTKQHSVVTHRHTVLKETQKLGRTSVDQHLSMSCFCRNVWRRNLFVDTTF